MKFTNEISELVYQDYRCIEPKDYQERIRFFEHNRSDINQLPYEMRLEISIEYTVALFEVGEYYQYLKYVDKLLEITIEDSVFSIDGDDIYQELLFRKGCALHNVVDFYAADHIFSELIKIDKTNKTYQQVFHQNKVSQLRYEGQKFRSLTIILLMITGVMIGVQLLIIHPFFEHLVSGFEWCRNIIFGFALFSIIYQELSIRWVSKRRIAQLTKKK